jgi:hypothetical protein
MDSSPFGEKIAERWDTRRPRDRTWSRPVEKDVGGAPKILPAGTLPILAVLILIHWIFK